MTDSEFRSEKFTDAQLASADERYLRFSARDKSKQSVLITALPASRGTNPEIVRQFKRHAQLLANQSQQNFVRLIDVLDPSDGVTSHHAMVTEAMPTDLSAVVKSSAPLMPKAAMSIIEQVLKAVDTLHRANYLHLGLSSNVVGTNASCSEIKLLGLGSCYSMNEPGASVNDADPMYGAPELYSYESVDSNDNGYGEIGPFSDIYSVGMMGYELLAGPRAFNKVFRQLVNEKNAEIRDKKWINWHRNSDPAPPVHELNPDVPESVSALISSMMSKDSRVRPRNVDECFSAINAGYNSRVASTPAKSSSPSGSGSSSPFIKYLIYGVSGSLLVLGIFGYYLYKKNRSLVVEPTVSREEFLQLAERNKILRTEIEKLGLVPNESFNDGQRFLQNARDSEKEGLDVQYDHLLSSTEYFETFFVSQTGEKKKLLTSELKNLVEEARDKRTRDLETVNFEIIGKTQGKSPVEITESVRQIEATISNYKIGILGNSRDFSTGSSIAEIEAALDLCKGYSNDCAREWYDDEIEQEVILEPFEMDPREVDVVDFKLYIDENKVVTEAEERNETSVTAKGSLAGYYTKDLFWYNQFPSDGKRYPVTHVTRLDASRYCRSIDKRLPTEAEWEYAARGVDRSIFPWGDDWQDFAEYRGDFPQQEFIEVAAFKPVGAGFYDLTGSVTEWTSTDSSIEGAGTAKGGSRFDDNPANLRLAVKRYLPIEYSGDDVGFRCARSTKKWND